MLKQQIKLANQHRTMGKSFGVNSKAKEGRERKEAQKVVKRQKETKEREEIEARSWEVGAKVPTARRMEDEKKKEEKVRQKLERIKLTAAEEAELEKLRPVKPLPKETLIESRPKQVTSSGSPVPFPCQPSETPFHSGPGSSIDAGERLSAAGDNVPEYSASNIDDALFLLDSTSAHSLISAKPLERHPERRIKATYAVFEEREMPKLRQEFPGLRLTQLREKLHKAWQKSPDNPFNQAHINYNATRSQEFLRASDDVESTLERLKLSPK